MTSAIRGEKMLAVVGLIVAGALLSLYLPVAETVNGDDTVAVSASISESVSCTSDPASTAFGTLTTGSVHTAATNATTTVSCNSESGCNLLVGDAGQSNGNPGLYKSAAPTHLIASADATLSAGTEGYGIQSATTTAGTGATLALNSKYRVTGNQVGGLVTNNSPLSIASSTSPVSGREVVVVHKAAISGLTKEGSYADTITYSCLGN